MAERGGYREEAGRKVSKTPDGTPRKMHSTNASDLEWTLILEFVHLVKNDFERAKSLLENQYPSSVR